MRWKKAAIIFAIITGVYVFMEFLLPVASPFLVGWLLSLLVYPWAMKIVELPIGKKVHLSRGVVGSVLILAVVAGIFLAFWILLKAFVDQISSLLSYYPQCEQNFLLFVEDCCKTVEKVSGIKASAAEYYIMGQIQVFEESLFHKMQPRMMGTAVYSVKKIVLIFSWVLLSVITAILFVKDLEIFQMKVQGYELYRKLRNVLLDLAQGARTFLKAQCCIIGIMMLLCVSVFYLLGNKHFVIWGIGLGFVDALPVLGTGIVLVPWAVLLFIRGETGLAVCYLLFYLLASALRQFLEPKLIGKKMGIHPLCVLGSIYLGFFVYGGSGFILGPISALIIMGIIKEWDLGKDKSTIGKEN